MTSSRPSLILASRSPARRTMLENAGLTFSVSPASLDEAAFMRDHPEKDPEKITGALAAAKSLHVSAENLGSFVIGADQVLEFEGEILMKSETAAEAKRILRRLSGKTHRLVSSACVALNEEILWAHTDEACLTMRDVDEDFIGRYARRAGAALTECVGGYELGRPGSWLFSKVEGDFFTILGLPLLPLLTYLDGAGLARL
ncbi:MAG: Maf family protein [Alphaproteobacteria bacterium]|nr:Maf family protein [Alphaproteobacteria bacterium]